MKVFWNEQMKFALFGFREVIDNKVPIDHDKMMGTDRKIMSYKNIVKI